MSDDERSRKRRLKRLFEIGGQYDFHLDEAAAAEHELAEEALDDLTPARVLTFTVDRHGTAYLHLQHESEG